MGQSKGGGYVKKEVLSNEQMTVLQQLLQQVLPNMQASAEGYKQFLPGGGGGQAIANNAQQMFQQQTMPSILNAFGTNSKSSSALNQALAAGASNLNSDIGAKLAQMQLTASQGLGGLSSQLGNLGIQTPNFAYLERQMPFWQSMLLGGTDAAAKIGAAYLGA